MHYQNNYPGQVQVLGADLFDGTPAALGEFKSHIQATFPLLLLGNGAGGNLTSLYGPWDDYVVINKQGIVRYHADIAWDHGNRYHLNEIRGCVDSLVSSVVGVGDPPLQGFALTSGPNPFRGRTTIALTGPTRADRVARITVHDLGGRRVATLWDGPLPPAGARVTWDGNTDRGVALPAGVYLIRAESGGVKLSRRVIRMR